MKENCFPVINLYETGQNIKHWMLLKGFTVKEIQEYLELSTPQSIYHWFDGRNLPTIDNLYALSELFCVPMDILIKGNRKYSFVHCSLKGNQRVFVYYEKLLLNKCVG